MFVHAPSKLATFDPNPVVFFSLPLESSFISILTEIPGRLIFCSLLDVSPARKWIKDRMTITIYLMWVFEGRQGKMEYCSWSGTHLRIFSPRLPSLCLSWKKPTFSSKITFLQQVKLDFFSGGFRVFVGVENVCENG